MGTGEMVVKTNSLSKWYKGVPVLDNLNLSVPKGSIFGFLGPNGAGKTTTMKLLLGLIFPTSGGATVFGRDIVKDSIYIRSRIGYLSQSPRFYGHMTARENLEFVAGFFYREPPARIKKRVDEMLELVGLTDKADRIIKNFSGGEFQRLGIAQAQINNPELLILDEPMASLDPIGRKEIIEVMEKLKKTTTIFYSTHILEDVQRVSDTVAILDKGKVIACGPIDEVLKRDNEFAYEIIVSGNAEKMCADISAQKWVSRLVRQVQDGQWKLTVYVSDKAAADRQLFKLMQVQEDLIVIQYKHKEYQLEEAFMDIIGRGENNG